MPVDRRRFVLSSTAALAACATSGANSAPLAGLARPTSRYDELLVAHADVLPEAAGSGANHDPMAAEVLLELGRADSIPPSWFTRASSYGPVPAVRQPIAGIVVATDGDRALGDPARFADWREHFLRRLTTGAWSAVIQDSVPWLAAGLLGAAWHGLLRTAHAVRALRATDTPARRGELANGLAYWAAQWAAIPAAKDGGTVRRGGSGAIPAPRLLAALARLPLPLPDVDVEPPFAQVTPRLVAVAPRHAVVVAAVQADLADPGIALQTLVHESTIAYHELLSREHQRIWLLHAVTGPAAVALLLPELSSDVARDLVAHAHCGVLAMYAAFGLPLQPRAHISPSPPPWAQLLPEAIERRSVHTLKLVEALHRCDRGDDPVWRSAAATWLAWR
jgi:hypothetical protein